MKYSKGHSKYSANFIDYNRKSLQKISAISFGLLLLVTVPLMDSAFAGADPPNTIPVGDAPNGLVSIESLKSIYVANEGSSTISVIDVDPTHDGTGGQPNTFNTVVQTIPVGTDSGSHLLLYVESLELLYVSGKADNSVHIIDVDPSNVATFNTVLPDPILVGANPFDLDYNSITKKVYIANTFSSSVSVIDVDPTHDGTGGQPNTFNTVVNTIPVGAFPVGVAVNTNTNLIYVSNLLGNSITVIDGTDDSVGVPLNTGTPGGMFLNEDTNELLVGNIFAVPGTITVYDINPSSLTFHQVIKIITVGAQPQVPVINTNTELIFVPNLGDATVSVIDASIPPPPFPKEFEVLGSLPVEPTPNHILVDEGNNQLYITHQQEDFVSIVDLDGNFPPTARAGPDQQVDEGTDVGLDGTNSDDLNGDDLTFLWTQTEGQMVTLDDNTNPTPSFTAPPEVVVAENLLFQLVVNDGEFDSEPSFVNVVVRDPTVFSVPLAGSSEDLSGGVTVESFPAERPITFLLDAPVTVGNGALDSALITSTIPGTDVGVDFNVRQEVPQVIGFANENLENSALYFEIDVDGIDLSNPANLPSDNPARTKFFVSKDYKTDAEFPDGSPVVPFLRLNEQNGLWETLGDPNVPTSNTFYIVDLALGQISVVDGNTNNVITTISGGGINFPIDTIVKKSVNNVYVYNSGDGKVPVIDMTDNSIITVIPEVQAGGLDPFDPTTEKLYLGSPEPGKLNVIDTTTDRIVAVIDHGVTSALPSTQHIPSIERLFIPNTLQNQVVVVDTITNMVIATIDLPSSSSDIHFDSDTNLLYLTLFTVGEVAVIDGESLTLVDTIPVGNTPIGIRANAATDKVFVANFGSGTISVIDTNVNLVVATIPVEPFGLFGLDINKNTDRVYVVNGIFNTMSIIDGSTFTVLDTVPIPGAQLFIIDVNDRVPNPVRDPASDTADQFAYIGQTDHLSKFSIGGIRALSLGALAGNVGSNSGGGSAPSLDNISFDGATTVNENGIIGFGGTLVNNIASENNLPTQTAEVGVPFEIILPFTEDNGVGALQHVSIYFLQGDEKTIHDSQTSITYQPNSPVEYTNSGDFISDVTAEGSIKSAHKVDVRLGMTFNSATEEGESLDAILISWDKFRRSSEIKFNNFLQVMESSSPSPVDLSTVVSSEWSQSIESNTIKSTTVLKEESDGTQITFDTEGGQSVTNNFKIPKWIKYNANWWSQNEISEDDFVDGMKYLIEHDIMDVSQKQRVSILEPTPEVVIPDWIKNNASWWADDLVTDQEFVKAIEWLMDEGVIVV